MIEFKRITITSKLAFLMTLMTAQSPTNAKPKSIKESCLDAKGIKVSNGKTKQ